MTAIIWGARAGCELIGSVDWTPNLDTYLGHAPGTEAQALADVVHALIEERLEKVLGGLAVRLGEPPLC